MINIKLEDNTSIVLTGLLDRISDLTPAWRSIHAYMLETILYHFDAMSGDLGNGKTYRSVTWRYFANQYTRKTDNVTVPAWGGVKRVVFPGGYMSLGNWVGGNRPNYRRTAAARKQNNGLVLGRLRTDNPSSNIRVKKGDSIMQRTGKMRKGILKKVHMTNTKIEMDSLGYRKKIIAQNRMRPFLFFENPTDVDRIQKIIETHIKGVS